MTLKGDKYNFSGGNQRLVKEWGIIGPNGSVTKGPTIFKIEGAGGAYRKTSEYAISESNGLYSKHKDSIETIVFIIKYKDRNIAHVISKEDFVKKGRIGNRGSQLGEVKRYCAMEHFKEAKIIEKHIDFNNLKLILTGDESWDISYNRDLLNGLHRFEIEDRGERDRFVDELKRGVYDTIYDNPRYRILIEEEQFFLKESA
jgi:hypothetical protein